jgi:hypothetical protein
MGTCVLVDRFEEGTDQSRIVGYTLLMDRSSFPEERLELRKDIFQVPANRIPEITNPAFPDITTQIPSSSKLSCCFYLRRFFECFRQKYEMP